MIPGVRGSYVARRHASLSTIIASHGLLRAPGGGGGSSPAIGIRGTTAVCDLRSGCVCQWKLCLPGTYACPHVVLLPRSLRSDVRLSRVYEGSSGAVCRLTQKECIVVMSITWLGSSY